MVKKTVLGENQLKFLNDEFGITEEMLDNITADEWQEIRLKCFDIECDEIIEDGGCSEYGELASDIVSVKFCNLFKE